MVVKENKYKCSNYVVAFIDVLGSCKKILNSEEESLNTVHSSYEEAVKYMGSIFDKKMLERNRPRVRIFSDNIIVFAPVINDDINIAFMDVLILTSMIQTEFLSKGYLVRGGIAYGAFFADDIMVWGKALISAYNIENKIAVFPRIVLDSSLEKNLEIKKYDNLLKKDTDECWFVDYLSSGFGLDNNTLFGIINSSCQTIDIMIREENDNVSVLQKLNWHKNYLRVKMDKLIGIDKISNILDLFQDN